ncbi:MAG: cobalamin biosynthesis bifunctional protein CbiET [Planctomycetota bacterium]|nr:MAG: cobalamin biosynthesis bifunctional protein CbiET [Planctomycetota bacterium]
MPSANVSIIGIGDDGLDGLTDSVRRLIEDARLLVGNERVLALVPASGAERLVLGADVEAAAQRIADQRGQVAVLVSGDPLFYGLARFLCQRVGQDRCEIIPHVSSMQLAFARVKESWDDASLINLANHPLEAVVERIRTAEKAGLFTTEEHGPDQIAAALLKRRIDYFTAYVCENLGARNERVTRGTLAEIAGQQFDLLNVMILLRSADVPDRPRDPSVRSLFGNPDETFIQSKPKQGLLTTAEVRAVALAQMALGPHSVVWDVGAGSGSVSVEAAQLVPAGQVYAIEQDIEDAELIRENADRFGVRNVTPVTGRAPEVWADLPDPDAVFMEGSGREIVRLAELAFARLKPAGRLVASIASIEALHEVRTALAALTSEVNVWMLNVSRGADQLQRLRFEALDPRFLVAAAK